MYSSVTFQFIYIAVYQHNYPSPEPFHHSMLSGYFLKFFLFLLFFNLVESITYILFTPAPIDLFQSTPTSHLLLGNLLKCSFLPGDLLLLPKLCMLQHRRHRKRNHIISTKLQLSILQYSASSIFTDWLRKTHLMLFVNFWAAFDMPIFQSPLESGLFSCKGKLLKIYSYTDA